MYDLNENDRNVVSWMIAGGDRSDGGRRGRPTVRPIVHRIERLLGRSERLGRTDRG